MAKRKVTPFARFLLAMIIIVPLAFAGASYINGEDPIQNFKELTGMESSAQPAKADKPKAEQPKTTSQPKPSDKQQASPSKGESLSEENARLKKELEKRDRAIKDLQEQLKKCQ